MAYEPVPDADFTGDVDKQHRGESEERGLGDEVRNHRGLEGHGAGSARHFGDGVEPEGDRGQGAGEDQQFAGLVIEELRGDQGGDESAESEEQVQKVEDAVDRQSFDLDEGRERVGAGDDRAAAGAEDKHEGRDGAVAFGGAESEEREGDQTEAEEQADLLALRIHQGADEESADHEADRLRHGDVAVLLGREVEAFREVGQDGPEHGGDDAVDEDGENGGNDQHGLLSLSEFRELNVAGVSYKRAVWVGA